MVNLICDRPQLTGAYGTVTLGEEFEVSEDLARHLIENGLAHRAEAPKVQYETKVITPEAPEVSPQLTGAYGTVTLGEEFEVSEDLARHLIENGLAHRAEAPKVQYETKVITPEAPEVSPRQPFRSEPGDVPVSDAQPARVAPASDSMLSAADVPAAGTPHRVRRSRRKEPGTQ